MKREGQGEGGVHSRLKRRSGEQRCGCKSVGQHVTHSMKGLCVCVREAMLIFFVFLP